MAHHCRTVGSGTCRRNCGVQEFKKGLNSGYFDFVGESEAYEGYPAVCNAGCISKKCCRMDRLSKEFRLGND